VFQRESNQRIAERRQRKKNRTRGKEGEKPSGTRVAAEDSASSGIEDALDEDV
jgi:hypothetical protein